MELDDLHLFPDRNGVKGKRHACTEGSGFRCSDRLVVKNSWIEGPLDPQRAVAL
jgi:hypothetical protein